MFKKYSQGIFREMHIAGPKLGGRAQWGLRLGPISFILRAIGSLDGVELGLRGIGLHLRLFTIIDGGQAGKSNAEDREEHGSKR